MIEQGLEINRLPRNFHKTFVPERQHISALLRYAASEQNGDYQEIANATGIPMGTSTGKVPAIIDYCRGMGLIRTGDNKGTSKRKPELTPFGRNVYLEDRHLKEGVTQWLAHLNLCSPISGAEAWYHTFFPGFRILGSSFSREQLENYLSNALKVRRGKLIGPLIRMYEDEGSFGTCGVLSEEGGKIQRKPAPVTGEFGPAYGAWLVNLVLKHFPGRSQVTTNELDEAAGCMAIPGWESQAFNEAISLVEKKGMIRIDRHMEPWIVHLSVEPEEAWNRIYDNLL